VAFFYSKSVQLLYSPSHPPITTVLCSCRLFSSRCLRTFGGRGFRVFSELVGSESAGKSQFWVHIAVCSRQKLLEDVGSSDGGTSLSSWC